MDNDACERMMCTPPDSVLSQLGYDPSTIDFKATENGAFWNEIRTKLDYRFVTCLLYSCLYLIEFEFIS